uniref:Structure-specific endonuclease subunit SLX1 homolog n=1 Tax=Globodera rostochiensis TaxID=31243 RepID=A0A914GZK7_GLORO
MFPLCLLSADRLLPFVYPFMSSTIADDVMITLDDIEDEFGDDVVAESCLDDASDGAIIRDEPNLGHAQFGAKSSLEKTILLDESLEANIFETDEGSPLKQFAAQPLQGKHGEWRPPPSPFAGGLSPFKRISFGHNVKEELPTAALAVDERHARKRGRLPAVGGRINLEDLCDPLLPPKQKLVQDEFFGVYCLVSKSVEKCYKNRCYIGFTVDPNRRIRQHNAGKQAGGAKKTDSRGPWDMVCIVHGFPNAISALRFEWAWQNPKRSKRLKRFVERGLAKQRRETPFIYCHRVACRMLNTAPWCEMALTFRWLNKEYETPFPPDCPLPPHMNVAYGKVQKVNVTVPAELHEYITMRNCQLCREQIDEICHFLRCPATEICGAHFHVRCLAEHCLQVQGLLQQRLVPIRGMCPQCSVDFLWGELVRDQRTLLLVDDSKSEVDGTKIAGGMIPRRLQKS